MRVLTLPLTAYTIDKIAVGQIKNPITSFFIHFSLVSCYLDIINNVCLVDNCCNQAFISIYIQIIHGNILSCGRRFAMADNPFYILVLTKFVIIPGT